VLAPAEVEQSKLRQTRSNRDIFPVACHTLEQNADFLHGAAGDIAQAISGKRAKDRKIAGDSVISNLWTSDFGDVRVKTLLNFTLPTRR
jgi:hypothetical protein